MFVRPKKPSRFDFSGQSKEQFEYQYKRDLHQYENWKPMFKGDWNIVETSSGRYNLFCGDDFCGVIAGQSLDDFIRENEAINLFYHPEHEMI